MDLHEVGERIFYLGSQIYQVQLGVLNILSCWHRPHENGQYERQSNPSLSEYYSETL